MPIVNARGRTSFDDGWSFHLGDDIAKSRRLVPKAGTANGWSDLTHEELQNYGGQKTAIEKMHKAFQAIQLRPNSKDVEWTNVSLPHDWRIEQKPDPDHPYPEDYAKAWCGLWPVGVAYYRKVFTWPKTQGQHVQITFDGVAGYSDVWLNGFWIGQSISSYTPLSIDITELLRFDIPNVILVRSDSMEAEGWWMEGGGIYRHVWLESYGHLHIAQHGVYITTPLVVAEQAQVVAQVEITNEGSDAETVYLKASITDPTGAICASIKAAEIQIGSYQTSAVSIETLIKNPQLWQIGQGHVYTMKLEVIHCASTNVVDVFEQTFGVREIKCEVDGVVINGRKSKILGVNIHQDFGFYGSALPDRVIEAKLDLLAEMGVNTVRSAHHHPTPELVAHMDRRGMLLLAENRTMSSAPHALGLLRQQIRQFRSNPCVFMWSVENEEINLEGEELGRSILSRLVKECKALDPTRPVTCGGVENHKDKAYYGQLDVVGAHYPCFNGTLDETLSYNHPKPHLLDEEGLFASTRGIHHYDKANAYSGSFSRIFDGLFDGAGDLFGDAIAPFDPAKCSPFIHNNMSLSFTSPKVMGACIWTGFDYHGEPIPQRWPCVIAAFGQRDSVGIPKDYYWLIRSIFKPEPLVHGFPHWTWPGKEGEKLPFAVYSNCDEVEIILNGEAVGPRLQVQDYRALVPDEGLLYQPGTLTVRGYRNGVALTEHTQHTAGPAASLRLVPDRTDLSSSGHDLAMVRVIVTDADGNFVPESSDFIRFSVTGVGHIGGSGNGNTVYNEFLRNSGNKLRVFKGQAVVFVHAKNEVGNIELTVSLDGIDNSSAGVSLCVSEEIVPHGTFNALDEQKVSAYGVYKTLSGQKIQKGV